MFYTIESIAAGRPVPIQLWLDAKDYDAPWPASLQRLVDRGLQVYRSDGDYGPHTKYWGAFANTQGAVITVDDDMIYPGWFVDTLINRAQDAAAAGQRQVIAYRAHRIGFDGDTMRPYVRWTPARSTTPSYRHFATGVSGVYYPPSFIEYARSQGTAFTAVSPRADDVWLHALALRSGHKIRQVFRKPQHFNVVPSTQLGALVLGNTVGGGNDTQIAQVYTEQDLQLLRESN